MLFERFVSRERNEAPDIDVDFEHERREEVLAICLRQIRPRAGRHDGRGDHLSPALGDARRGQGAGLVARSRRCAGQDARWLHATSELAEPLPRRRASIPTSPIGRQLIGLVDELLGFPRHLSQHVGGMVMTQGPLCELVPIENAAMDGRTVIEWDKDDLDELGILESRLPGAGHADRDSQMFRSGASNITAAS